MFNNVAVSVCLPIYNGALYIRDAIQSILNQTGNAGGTRVMDVRATLRVWFGKIVGVVRPSFSWSEQYLGNQATVPADSLMQC